MESVAFNFDLFFYLALGGGFLMAFSLGANDVANSMASAVGARAITVRQAVVIAGLLNFAGAAFLGANVVSTISKGIVNPEYINSVPVLAVGMFSALLTAGLWVLISTLTGAPVSSTHSVVGAILGFGLIAAGPQAVQWPVMVKIALSWILSPVLAALVAGAIYMVIKITILDRKKMLRAARICVPGWVFLTSLLLALSFIFKTPFGRSFHEGHPAAALTIVVVVPLLFAFSAWLITKRLFPQDEGTEKDVEQIYRTMQIGTSSYVALSQGANDVANAMGPVVALYILARYHLMPEDPAVPIWILALGGIGIAIGVAALGYKVMATVGEKITTLTNTKGFSVDFSVATTILVASHMGIPVSSTTVAVGSVAGVGATQGLGNVNFRTLGKCFLFWVLTVPIASLTSMGFFLLLKAIFLQH